jgi:hypothetical protein
MYDIINTLFHVAPALVRVSTKSLSNLVGNYDQRRGSNPDSDCGPTSGANIIQYWHNTSYPSLGDITTYGGETGFIDHMRDDMDSWFFETTVGWYVNGMQLHLNGYSVPRTVSSTLSPNTTYTQLTSEITNSRPVGIKIDMNSLGESWYSYHWVTGVGYYARHQRRLSGHHYSQWLQRGPDNRLRCIPAVPEFCVYTIKQFVAWRGGMATTPGTIQTGV